MYRSWPGARSACSLALSLVCHTALAADPPPPGMGSPRGAEVPVATAPASVAILDANRLVVFFDDFESGQLASDRWSSWRGAAVARAPGSAGSEGRPGNLGVRLAPAGSEAPVAEIRSAAIVLDDLPAALVLSLELCGSSPGTLTVEFLDRGGAWAEIGCVAEVVRPQPRVFVVPPALRAGQTGFRLRVSGGDGFFIDEVRLVAGQRQLSVDSRPETGVAVHLEPAGRVGDPTDVLTRFARVFDVGTLVTISARPRTARLVFQRWVVDGRAQPAQHSTLAHVVVDDASLVAQYAYLGDMNGDGVVSRDDVDVFVLAVIDPEGYARHFPELDRVQRGDFNGDGALDEADIEAFVERLLSP